MAIDRYSRDYRLKDSVDERGRIRTEAEYIGPSFVFREGVRTARRTGKTAALFCAVAWLGFLTALYPESDVGHAVYAVLPCALLALPLWMLSAVAVLALRVKEPFTRKEQERFTVRFPGTAIAVAALSALAILGGVICLLVRGAERPAADAVFFAGNALCMTAAVLCRRLRRRLECTDSAKD